MRIISYAVRRPWAEVVYAAELVGYWVRPYDMLADRRRWRWQRRQRCGFSYGIEMEKCSTCGGNGLQGEVRPDGDVDTWACTACLGSGHRLVADPLADLPPEVVDIVADTVRAWRERE